MSEPARDEREWTLWLCPECGWSSSSYPPRGQCCGVAPHENYTMESFAVVPKSRAEAAERRVQELEAERGLLLDARGKGCEHDGTMMQGECDCSLTSVTRLRERVQKLESVLREIAGPAWRGGGTMVREREPGVRRMRDVARSALSEPSSSEGKCERCCGSGRVLNNEDEAALSRSITGGDEHLCLDCGGSGIYGRRDSRESITERVSKRSHYDPGKTPSGGLVVSEGESVGEMRQRRVRLEREARSALSEPSSSEEGA